MGMTIEEIDKTMGSVGQIVGKAMDTWDRAKRSIGNTTTAQTDKGAGPTTTTQPQTSTSGTMNVSTMLLVAVVLLVLVKVLK